MTGVQTCALPIYRVIPVHAELLENGILLEGMQSVQVARVEKPDPVSDWLTQLLNRSDTQDRPASLFAE